jgi:AraC-like DNA-binding protein
MSPHQWLLGRRIGKAKTLLTESSFTLSQIALACGFSSQSHFNAAFKSAMGISPGQWRRALATRVAAN